MKSTLFKIIFISVIMVLVKIAFDIYKGIANPIHYNPNLLVFLFNDRLYVLPSVCFYKKWGAWQTLYS